MKHKKILFLLCVFPLIACSTSTKPSGTSADEVPLTHETVWQQDNYTFELYDSQGKIVNTCRFTDEGAEIGENKVWYHADGALNVYYINNQYVIYESDLFGSYYNYQTIEVFRTYYEFKDASLRTKFNSYQKYYYTSPGKDGIDYLSRRIAKLAFDDENYIAILNSYPNFCTFFSFDNNEVFGYLITNRSNIGDKYSYWLSFKIKNVGTTKLSFTPIIDYVGSSHNTSGE